MQRECTKDASRRGLFIKGSWNWSKSFIQQNTDSPMPLLVVDQCWLILANAYWKSVEILIYSSFCSCLVFWTTCSSSSCLVLDKILTAGSIYQAGPTVYVFVCVREELGFNLRAGSSWGMLLGRVPTFQTSTALKGSRWGVVWNTQTRSRVEDYIF